MVRVISVHHFTQQDVNSLDRADGHGVASGKEDCIFIGGEHKIEIHDLKHGTLLKGNFPTVDLVHQLIYCKKGNYVCTLESKPARHGGDHTFVRVYLNWENEHTNQPMKARIAGRVTPGSQSGLDYLEMVEIPTKQPVEYISCCQTTGNLALASGMIIYIFKYCLKTHDMSKMKFVDFDEMLEIDSAFVIKEIALAEDFIGVVSDTEANIFQVVFNAALLKSVSEENQLDSLSQENRSKSRSKSRSISKTRSASKSPGRISECSMTPFKGKKVVQKETNMQLTRKAENYIDLANMLWSPTLSYGKANTDANSDFLLFPSLVGATQCGIVTNAGETFGPKSSSQCSNVRIKLLSGYGNSQRISTGIFDAVTFLHRRLDQGIEPDLPFSNLKLFCIYNNNKGEPLVSKNSTHPLLPMIGEKYYKKIGASVFLTTPHTGYLYHISLACNSFNSTIVCGGVFSYTAPVDTVTLEPCLLHALTLTGLETYTLRPHPCVIEAMISSDNDIIVPPNWEETVCLVGLRPFFNVKSLILTDSCLALIASNEESGEKSDTIYALHLPSSANLYKEMIRVGLGHRAASPSTYFHLLLEAYFVLLISIHYKKNEENHDKIPEEDEDLMSLLQDSSSLLGDYYASCTNKSEWNQAVHYYQASTLTPDAIVERLSPETPGLVYILTSLLLNANTPVVTASQANHILDVLKKIAPEEVANLVLKSTCIKEYKKEKVLNIIKQELSKVSEPRPIDVLALALIIQDKGSPEQVASVLTSLRTHQLVEVLLQHSRLLLERNENELNLSSFAQILLEHRKEAFMEVFVLLIGEGTLSLNSFVDAFINVYPIVSCEIECNVNSLWLRDLIESFFLEYGHLPVQNEQKEKYGKAVSVLISLYIASLLGAFNSESEENKERSEHRSVWINLFGDRPPYLNYLPPFNSKPPATSCKINKRKNLEKSEKEKNDTEILEKVQDSKPAGEMDAELTCCCQQCHVDLLLLQSLLSSDLNSAEDCATVYKVASSNPEIKGSSSLQVLCLDPSDQLTYIIDHHSYALLQYCKDTYESPWEWESVISRLIERVNKLPKEDPQYETLGAVLNDVLNELVMSSSFEMFIEILPKCHHDQFKSYIRQCHSAGLACFLKETFIAYAGNVLQQMFSDGKG